MTPEEVRAIVREEMDAFFKRVAETTLLDLSAADAAAGSGDMTLLKMLLDEVMPAITGQSE